MGKSDMLRVAEVRDAYRLIGECRDLGNDSARWFPRMLEGMSRLVGSMVTGGEGLAPRADGAMTPLSTFDSGLSPSDRAVLGAYVRDGGPAADPLFARLEYVPGKATTRTRRQLVRDADYHRSSVYDRYFRVGKVEHRLVSAYQQSAEPSFSLLHLYRAPRERDFSPREQRLLSFFHAELGPLVGRALVSIAEASPDDLSPRLRQTLACLLEGESEKQVAGRLGLSLPTTHQYVTALYKRFGVRSRAQLLAHALRRSGRPPWCQLISSV
jgi:DNA-binding CsgD family transcriptional regulator